MVERELRERDAVSFMEVVRMVKESSFSDTAIQFFFICILHISYDVKIKSCYHPSRAVSERKRVEARPVKSERDFHSDVFSVECVFVCLFEYTNKAKVP